MTNPHRLDLATLPGVEALEALVHVIENTANVEIEGNPIDHIGAIEHTTPPRDIIVSARSLGRQMLLSFGSADTPIIDYRLTIIGSE